MKYQKVADAYIVRLEIGEEVCDCLTRLAEHEGITLAEISGIGACDYVSAGRFDPPTREYIAAESREHLEIISLSGSLSLNNGAPYLHIHALLADPFSGSSIAGHITKLVISATAEIILHTMPAKIDRFVCEKTGLSILDLPNEL